jgi:hypothetical protein
MSLQIILFTFYILAFGIVIYLFSLTCEQSIINQIKAYRVDVKEPPIKHSIKVKKLYEKRIESIEGLYSRLLTLGEVIKGYYHEEFDDYRIIFNCQNEFNNYHKSKAIYLNPQTNDKIRSFLEKSDFIFYLSLVFKVPTRFSESAHEAMQVLALRYNTKKGDLNKNSLQDLIYNDFPQLSEDLITEMRTVLDKSC